MESSSSSTDSDMTDLFKKGNGDEKNGGNQRRLPDNQGEEHDDVFVQPEGEEEDAVVSKYAKVNQPCPFSKIAPVGTINLEWRNINYKVVILLPPQNFILRQLLTRLPWPNTLTNMFKRKMEVDILHNVSGCVRSGQLLAIMGPTGSGKTTLLNVLAQRITSNVTGEILINGEAVPGSRLKRRMAYVLQDDIFFPNLTVRDTITYTAYLKLSKTLSLEEKRQRVDDILTELGLQRCSNTIVGGGWVRGVSGGERKRTNIGNELVSNPGLVFLDEPTSGLDSSTALGLIVSLKNLAKSGHTVVSTIHQPSSAMFLTFDHVILLAEGGWVVYSGAPSKVLPYFAKLGLQAPPHYNPADFMLEVVTTSEVLKDGTSVKQMLIDTYAEKEKNEEEKRATISTSEAEQDTLDDIKHGPKYQTGFFLQLWIMAKRAFKQRRGDVLNWLQVFTIFTIAILVGLLWFQMSKTESTIGNRSGFLFFGTMFWILNPWFNALQSFPPERAVLTKERGSGNYRLSAYFLGKILAETPLELVLPTCWATITYWMVGLSTFFPNYMLFVALMWLNTLMGGSVGLLISASIINVKQALTISVILLLGSVLLGGFFVSGSSIPVWIAWARWLSMLKYAYEALLINEFQLSGQTFTPSNPSSYFANVTTGDTITGTMILDHFHVETTIWGDIIFLVGVTIVGRFLAYMALRFLNKPKA